MNNNTQLQAIMQQNNLARSMQQNNYVYPMQQNNLAQSMQQNYNQAQQRQILSNTAQNNTRQVCHNNKKDPLDDILLQENNFWLAKNDWCPVVQHFCKLNYSHINISSYFNALHMDLFKYDNYCGYSIGTPNLTSKIETNGRYLAEKNVKRHWAFVETVLSEGRSPATILGDNCILFEPFINENIMHAAYPFTSLAKDVFRADFKNSWSNIHLKIRPAYTIVDNKLAVFMTVSIAIYTTERHSGNKSIQEMFYFIGGYVSGTNEYWACPKYNK
jgi:hypothetical protein